MCFFYYTISLRGFVKLKKTKSEKNSEVGGWFMAQLGFLIFVFLCCFRVFVFLCCFQMFRKKQN